MRYAKINLLDIANGEGIRVSLFVSGCRFGCPECFNKEAQNFSYGKEYTEETEKLILKRLADERIDGLSLLGGDPLCQDSEGLKQLIHLCQETHKLNKTIWLWSGYIWEEIEASYEYSKSAAELEYLHLQQLLLKCCDVMVDGRFINNQKDLSLAWRGSRNQRVINIPETIKTSSIVVVDTE